MEQEELAFVNVSGAKLLIYKNSSDGYETFGNSATDLSTLLTTNGFTSFTDMVEEAAHLRDHALTDE